MGGQTEFDTWIAGRYERLWPELFDPAVLDPPWTCLWSWPARAPRVHAGVRHLSADDREALLRGIEAMTIAVQAASPLAGHR